PELLRVLGVHSVEPRIVLEAPVTVRRDADSARCANHSVRMTRGTREGVRPAARAAGDAEALEAELVGDRGHVVDRIDDAPAVTGGIVRDVTDAELLVHALVGPTLQPAPRRPVHAHDRETVRIAPHGERKGAPLGRLQGPERLAHRSEHTTFRVARAPIRVA